MPAADNTPVEHFDCFTYLPDFFHVSRCLEAHQRCPEAAPAAFMRRLYYGNSVEDALPSHMHRPFEPAAFFQACALSSQKELDIIRPAINYRKEIKSQQYWRIEAEHFQKKVRQTIAMQDPEQESRFCFRAERFWTRVDEPKLAAQFWSTVSGSFNSHATERLRIQDAGYWEIEHRVLQRALDRVRVIEGKKSRKAQDKVWEQLHGKPAPRMPWEQQSRGLRRSSRIAKRNGRG